MKNLVLLFSIMLFTSNCAGFKNSIKNGSFNENNLNEIDGTYKNTPSSSTGVYVRSLTTVFDRNTNMFVFREKYDNKKDLKLTLKMINQKSLNVKVSNSENLLLDKNLKVKLKKDGFLYLKEKRLMIEGIPLAFGGLNVQKTRFTIDENHKLEVQSNYYFCNGFLIFMSDWKTIQHHLIFEKQ